MTALSWLLLEPSAAAAPFFDVDVFLFEEEDAEETGGDADLADRVRRVVEAAVDGGDPALWALSRTEHGVTVTCHADAEKRREPSVVQVIARRNVVKYALDKGFDTAAPGRAPQALAVGRLLSDRRERGLAALMRAAAIAASRRQLLNKAAATGGGGGDYAGAVHGVDLRGDDWTFLNRFHRVATRLPYPVLVVTAKYIGHTEKSAAMYPAAAPPQQEKKEQAPVPGSKQSRKKTAVAAAATAVAEPAPAAAASFVPAFERTATAARALAVLLQTYSPRVAEHRIMCGISFGAGGQPGPFAFVDGSCKSFVACEHDPATTTTAGDLPLW